MAYANYNQFAWIFCYLSCVDKNCWMAHFSSRTSNKLLTILIGCIYCASDYPTYYDYPAKYAYFLCKLLCDRNGLPSHAYHCLSKTFVVDTQLVHNICVRPRGSASCVCLRIYKYILLFFLISDHVWFWTGYDWKRFNINDLLCDRDLFFQHSTEMTWKFESGVGLQIFFFRHECYN